MKINIYLGDSLKAMETMPDNKYGLSIVDVPYGINHSEIAGKQSGTKYGNAAAKKRNYDIKYWDKSSPNKLYFNELKRVSKNQIIWGANHFTNKINENSSCWIVWDKCNGTNNFADCELAYTSFKSSVRKFTFMWNGMLTKNNGDGDARTHPTQKPVALYKWLLKNYGFNKDGSKRTIFDSHGGSMSLVIACIDMGFDIDCWEIDVDYYSDAVKRIRNHLAQGDAFREKVEINYFDELK